MIKTNIVTLKEFRDLKENRRTQESYQRYLSSLANCQLESEINFLLEEFSLDNYGKDFFSKVKLVQNEIVARADDNWKMRIQQMNRDHQLLQP